MAYRRSTSRTTRRAAPRRASTRRAAPRRASARRAAPRRAATQTVRIVLETRADSLPATGDKVLSAREVPQKKAKF